MKDHHLFFTMKGEPCSVALYRLPGETRCCLMAQRGAPLELPSPSSLNGRSGFVLAPFAVNDDDRLLLLQPEMEASFAVDDISPDGHLPIKGDFPLTPSEGEGNFHPTSLNSSEKQVDCHAISPSSIEDGKDGTAASQSLRGGKDNSEPQENKPFAVSQTDRRHYSIDFANFHSQLIEGRFQKLVLARSAFVDAPMQSPVALFRKACQLYPYAFTALVATPQSGIWLMATPEILLEEKEGRWHTIALAGTMEAGENLTEAAWSTKNIVEQRYVATYIMRCLERFAYDIREEGPTTACASNVVHLRSDFHFSLPDAGQIGTLLQALHPTPAVCGLPKDEACAMIVRNEASPRHYYSGFAGPLQTDAGTHLFVSLRCMQLLDRGYRLYAGGGLLPDSDEEQEWQETEAKMQAMQQLIAHTS